MRKCARIHFCSTADFRWMANPLLGIFVLMIVISLRTPVVSARLGVVDSSRLSSRRSLIVNGQDSSVEKFPFYADLRIYKNEARDESIHLCGSSLVAPNVVLTAAHCVYGYLPEHLVFAFNSDSYFATGDNVELISATKIIVHPEYQQMVDAESQVLLQYANDLALVILSSPSELGKVVKFANFDTDARAGETATIIGWGNTVQGAISRGRVEVPSRRLQEVNMQVIGNDRCDAYYRFAEQHRLNHLKEGMDKLRNDLVLKDRVDAVPGLKNFVDGLIKDSMSNVMSEIDEKARRLAAIGYGIGDDVVCAQDISVEQISGPCSGDSGGPLLVTREGEYLVIGVASFVVDCATGEPNAFNRASRWSDFISETIREYQNFTVSNAR